MFYTQGVFHSQCWFRQLRVKTQILIICSIFCTIILAIQISAILHGQRVISQALQRASDNIFKWQSRTVMNNIWIYQKSMAEQIEITKHQITAVRHLYQFVELFQIETGSQRQPQMCLVDPNERDQYCFSSVMCCGVFGKPINESLSKDLHRIMITTSLLNELRLELDLTSYSPLYFTYFNEAQFYCKSKAIPLNYSFKPFLRPYFLEHLKFIANNSQSDDQYFASPYKAIANQIRCPITTSLLDFSGHFHGVIIKDLDFNYSSIKKKYYQNMKNFIIAQDGKVIFTSKYRLPDVPIFYIYEQNYSGFNDNDFQQIMLKHYGQPFQSHCDNFQSDDLLCIYNSDLKDNVIVQTANITNSPYILVILSQINLIKFEQNQYIQILRLKINEIIENYLLIMIVTSLAIIIFDQIVISVCLRQFYQVESEMKNQITSNQFIYFSSKNNKFIKSKIYNQLSQLKIKVLQNVVVSSTVTSLALSVVNLYNSISTSQKCQECYFQEQKQYPQKRKLQHKNFIIIKSLLQDVYNRESQSIRSLRNIE